MTIFDEAAFISDRLLQWKQTGFYLPFLVTKDG